MTAKCNQIVRELLHKKAKYFASNPSHFIHQSRRNFHFDHEVLQPEIYAPSSNVVTNQNLQPVTLSNLVDTTRTNNQLEHLQNPNVALPSQNEPKQLLGLKNSIDANYLQSRFYSTQHPFFIQKRSMGKKKWGNQAEEKCKEEKKKCPAQPCPKWVMQNCPPQKPQKQACDIPYIDPCCKKKLAPYASYSETCAERLDDDPSECMQCPWSKCGGVENIKVPKRKYHTAPTFHMNTTIGFKRAPPATIKTTDVKVPHIGYKLGTTKNRMLRKWCDATKEPCRRPPGKCDDVKRRQEEACEKEKREKKYECPPNPKKKKCIQSWPTAYRLWLSKGQMIPDVVIQNSNEILAASRCPKKPGKRHKKKVDPDMVTPDDDCMAKLPFHRDGMSYEKTRKSKQFDDKHCRRRPRKKLPSCGPGACNQDCAIRIDDTIFNGNGFTMSYNLQKRKDCDPDVTRNKKDCPDDSNVSDPKHKPKNPCCEKEKRGNVRPERPRVYVPPPPTYDK